MTLDPLLEADLIIQVHVMAALIAIGLGPFAIYRKKRDRVHRIMGRVWVVSMAAVAISALAIPAVVLPVIGPFGPIHLLSFSVMSALWRGIRAAIARDVDRHGAAMRSLYWQALGIAGAFTLLPGRRLNAVLFPQAPEVGLWLIGILGFGAVAAIYYRRFGWHLPLFRG